MRHTPSHPQAAVRPETSAAASFYNCLAPAYDRMTDFPSRVRHAGRLVETLVRRFGPTPATGIDLGCGTGAFACALAAAGFRAAGLDIAEDMLIQARRNALSLGLDVRFECGALEALPQPFEPGSAGLVLCLGNTLPHLLSPETLRRALTGLGNLLAPTGAAVVQILNYDRILARQERIVSVDRDDEATFVRFYDFLPDGLVRFNLLRTTWQGRQGRPEALISVLLRPYRRAELEEAAGLAGLELALCAGDAALSAYDAASAETILLVLRRPAHRGPA